MLLASGPLRAALSLLRTESAAALESHSCCDWFECVFLLQRKMQSLATQEKAVAHQTKQRFLKNIKIIKVVTFAQK